jgi:hypothetical protein
LNSEGSLKDKSKPHSKLTAIEHMLKEEIEASIGDTLDKNKDLKIVDIDESVGSKKSPKKQRAIKNDDEDYWSDFSDDDYS